MPVDLHVVGQSTSTIEGCIDPEIYDEISSAYRFGTHGSQREVGKFEGKLKTDATADAELFRRSSKLIKRLNFRGAVFAPRPNVITTLYITTL